MTLDKAQLKAFLILKLLFCALFVPAYCFAQTNSNATFQWKEISPGLSTSKYRITTNTSVIQSDIFIVKADISKVDLNVALAKDFSLKRTNVGTLIEDSKIIAAINSNFFDTQGEPLGLIVRNGEKVNNLHRGGNLLTGVFSIKAGQPEIMHRDSFNSEGVTIAVQSGPRLIEDSKPLQLNQKDPASRRSGIAVCEDNSVLLFATELRFPGATLQQIQQFLLEPDLKVKSALNFDGGSSSQLFVRNNPNIHISGGDIVPSFVVIAKKE